MSVRTTVELDADTSRAVEQLRRDKGLGVSEAINTLIRRGLLPRREPTSFCQQTFALGARIDLSNIGEALDVLEGPENR